MLTIIDHHLKKLYFNHHKKTRKNKQNIHDKEKLLSIITIQIELEKSNKIFHMRQKHVVGSMLVEDLHFIIDSIGNLFFQQ